MVSSSPTQEWSSLQDVFYRKTDIYNLTSWAVSSLQGQRVVLGRNGGLIAIVRDQSVFAPIGSGTRMKIGIYTAAGQMVESLPWDASKRIVSLGFTKDEQLAVVLDEGIVRLYRLLTPCPIKLGGAAGGSKDTKGSSTGEPVEATSNSYYVNYTLGQEATETGVQDAEVNRHGVVFLSGAGSYGEWQFPSTSRTESSINSNGGSEIRTYPRIPGQAISSSSTSALPFSWSMSAPASTTSEVGLYISPADSPTLYKLSLSQLAPQDMQLDRGPFYAIRPSPDTNLLALVTNDWKLWVVSSDLSRSLSEFDISECEGFTVSGSAGTPILLPSTGPGSAERKAALTAAGISQIEWCGSNTVAIAFRDQVVMVGPFGDSIRYYYHDLVHLQSEQDGLRILSTDRLEFLCKVHESTSLVFLPGSTDPASLLYDSSENFFATTNHLNGSQARAVQRKNAKADDGIRAMRAQLDRAVETCIEAAGYEWDVALQRRLMRAADFGKTFLDAHDPSSLIKMAQRLRVLNAARHYEVAIPISHDEYMTFGAESLISQLTSRNMHLLAIRISEYLHISPEPVLKHWARAKIARSNKARAVSASISLGNAEDDQVCEAIVEKFKSQPAVSYAEIAKDAWAAGRVRLATKLLVQEPRAVDQVPLLLNMREDKLALVKAIESGDTDLVYHALFRLKQQLSRADFFRIIQAPLQDATLAAAEGGEANSSSSYLALASNLLEAYARNEDREMLREFYFQDDRRVDSALLAIEEAQETNLPDDGDERAEKLATRIGSLKEAMKFFNEDKEHTFEGKLTDEQIKLLAFQSALEKDTTDGGGGYFVGLSLNDTIRLCIKRDLQKKAEKLRSDWKVPDKRFWNIKLRALVEMRDWEAVWAFASSKRPPIGYTPFIQRLIEAGETESLDQYLDRISDKADRQRLERYLQRLPHHLTELAEAITARLNEQR